VTAPLGGPLSVTSEIDGVNGGSVELLVRLEGSKPQVVIPATASDAEGTWAVTSELDVAASSVCACHFEGTSPPNTKIEVQFRVRGADGSVTLGPVSRVTVEDDRFEWRTLEDDLVRVHWYEGDDAFAQQNADVANQAIDRAAELLGTTLPEPVDLFVYATQQAMVEAVSPNRESIAGQADPTTDTMVVCASCQGLEVTVAHELTHLVFHETTDNPYHSPPRWLNEGIATYLSEGYSSEFSSVVNGAAASDTLIPLQGLAGLFPSQFDEFLLAYGESVSAVDYFVRTYSEETLWDLVRSYADGMSDDDAFVAATGADLASFNAAWTASLASEVREPVGPQPAPPGPVPSAWQGTGQPGSSPVPGSTPAPGSSPGPGGSPVPGSTPAPGSSVATPAPASPAPGVPGSGDSTTGVLLGVALFALVLIGIVAVVLLVQRNRNTRPPQAPMPPFGPPQY
jgi:hypothetical protein